MKIRARTLAWAFAGVFLGAAVLGVVANPLVGEKSLFVTNSAHNLVHMATAIGFIVAALRGQKASIHFMQVFGVVYVLTAFVGFGTLGAQPEGYLLNSIHINTPDNLLHLGLGIAIAAVGWLLQRDPYRRITVGRV